MKKIVLIGPVYPYRGGISHYTGLMYRELAKRFDVEMISYKMQYPRVLFKKEQKDYENDSFKIEAAKYMLHTADPFNIMRTARYIKRLKPAMVVIQWWHPYFAPCYKLLEWFMGRQNITYVCHNVFPHERFPLDKFLTRWVLGAGNHFVLHAEEEKRELLTIKADADCRVTPLPTYNAFRFRKITKAQAREELGLAAEEKVLLFFGFVREYKGLKYLLKALPMVRERLAGQAKPQAAGEKPAKQTKQEPQTGDAKDGSIITLYVVGEFGGDKESYMDLVDELGIAEHLRIIDRYMPDREVEPYFAAADAVVLPYVSATQSAIVQIAFGFEKPVIVTNVGGLPDVVEDGSTGFIVEPENAEALAEAVVRFYEEQKEPEFVKNVKEQAYRFDWERMGETIEGFLTAQKK